MVLLGEPCLVGVAADWHPIYRDYTSDRKLFSDAPDMSVSLMNLVAMVNFTV